MKTLVAGATGLVGSSLIRRAPNNVQLLTPTRAELDLAEKVSVREYLQDNKPDAIILAAAKVGGILANSRFQRDFLAINLEIQDAVIMSARDLGIKNLIFLGSSCIYPREARQPIKEEYLLTGPLERTNEGYALSKIAGVKLCEAIANEDNLNYFSLMPTNLYGPNDNFHPENSHVPAALISRFHNAKIKRGGEVTVWGTGTPRREFMHVDDLADACWHLLNIAPKGQLINVGTGNDVSISEFAELVAEIVGYRGKILFDHSKPDGTPHKTLDVSRINSFGWHAQIALRDGLETTYDWYQAALKRGEVREF